MTSKNKNYLRKRVWTIKTGYYQKAHESSRNLFDHSGFKQINSYIKSCHNILDVGCGEGTKLAQLGNKSVKKVGIDISSDAIFLAKKQYPALTFKKGDIAKLPFASKSFDAVYCAFVLEHVTNPDKIINEMIRVVKKNGLVILICPNFGAPNRHSPCFRGSKYLKLIKGLTQQLTPYNLGIETWSRVIPLSKGESHLADWDTVIEPELSTLINYLKEKKLIIKHWSSLWKEEVPDAHDSQKLFKKFSDWGIYPFIYWGPQILVVAQKDA